jgi:hypothetical protein
MKDSFQGGYQVPAVGDFGDWGSLMNTFYHVDDYLGIPLSYNLGETIFFGYF